MKIIYSHTDFDGVVSASLLSIATGIDYIKFVSNLKIWYEQFTGEEIVCDLPCPWYCKLWFDHHETNINEMKLRGIDIDKIPGKFEISPSCAQIVFNFFKEKIQFPAYFDSVVQQTNKIDSMDYDSIEEWRKESSIKVLANTTQFLNNEDYRNFVSYLIYISKTLRKISPEEIIKFPIVKNRYKLLKEEEETAIEIMKRNCFFHPADDKQEIIIIDTSEAKIPPRIDKNLAYLIQPEAECVLLINSIFKQGIKSNDLKFSAGINFTKKELAEKKNLASIFESLEIGGGHKSAAGAVINCQSKEEKNKIKERLIEKFINKWKEQ